MFVKAAPGLVIRDPVTKALIPAEGFQVPDGDLFWAKLLEWGDAIECDAPADQAAPLEAHGYAARRPAEIPAADDAAARSIAE